MGLQRARVGEAAEGALPGDLAKRPDDQGHRQLWIERGDHDAFLLTLADERGQRLEQGLTLHRGPEVRPELAQPLVHEEHSLELLPHQRDPGLDQCAEPRLERALGDHLVHPLVHEQVTALEEVQGEGVLRLEELVERGVGVPGSLTDGTDARLAQPVTNEEAQRMGEDLALRRGRVWLQQEFHARG